MTFCVGLLDVLCQVHMVILASSTGPFPPEETNDDVKCKENDIIVYSRCIYIPLQSPGHLGGLAMPARLCYAAALP